MRPRDLRVVIVTDPAVPDAEAMRRLAAALAAVPPGRVLVQVRDKRADGGPLLARVRAVAALGAPVWVNDRLDVALAAGAPGVHLPEAGMPIDLARRVAALAGRPIAIGCSRHAAAAARALGDADPPALVQLGPVWPTPSKAGMGEPLGVGALAVRRELSAAVDLVAVGGIDGPERAAAAARAGADAVAVIRAFWSAPTPAAGAAVLAELVAAVDSGAADRSRATP